MTYFRSKRVSFVFSSIDSRQVELRENPTVPAASEQRIQHHDDRCRCVQCIRSFTDRDGFPIVAVSVLSDWISGWGAQASSFRQHVVPHCMTVPKTSRFTYISYIVCIFVVFFWLTLSSCNPLQSNTIRVSDVNPGHTAGICDFVVISIL